MPNIQNSLCIVRTKRKWRKNSVQIKFQNLPNVPLVELYAVITVKVSVSGNYPVILYQFAFLAKNANPAICRRQIRAKRSRQSMNNVDKIPPSRTG
jgi:hypothetical protein